MSACSIIESKNTWLIETHNVQAFLGTTRVRIECVVVVVATAAAREIT